MIQENVNQILSFLVLFLHICLVLFIFFYFIFKKQSKWFFQWIGKWGVLFAFLLALISMIGSLYYSEIVLLEPCVLCWYQRIFMYPLVFILGMFLLKKKKDKEIISYNLMLSYIGLFFAAYQIFLQKFSTVDVFVCSPFTKRVSCIESYFVEYGYINLPVISLTVFILIIIFLSFAKKHG
jgi:disulfide bond formation protein DsbB